ncbi:MAG: uroporphyrinogen decarboxylase family protein [Phycisphaerae bacterium]
MTTTAPALTDGIHSLLPRDLWTIPARRRRDTYAITPNLPLMQAEFGYYSLDAWKTQGFPADADPWTFAPFGFEPSGCYALGDLGWCEAAFCPVFETKLIEDRGTTEIEQDFAGRHVLYFKGRRSGFMPEYVNHPVKDMKTWVDNVKWRLNPSEPTRFAQLESRMAAARSAAAQGLMICQNLIGGYMYLRSLIGPEELLYAFHDQPELIHDCMRTWFELADAVIAQHQRYVTLDEIFLGEDICYNHGSLISPDMMNEFLIPYYQQLVTNVKRRQIDQARHLYVQIDTDGDCRPTIPVYMKGIGMDVLSPFEVASGCDVVEIGRQYPNLVIRGGIDKRVLAAGRPAIDAMLNYIYPAMKQRGGFIPTCDHGVPAEVPYQDYLYFRQRCLVLGA